MSQISLQSGPKISLALVANMFWDLFFVAISSRTVKCRGSTKSDSATGFAGLAPVSRFPGLGTDFTFSRAWHRLRVFPRLAPFFHLQVSSYCLGHAASTFHRFGFDFTTDFFNAPNAFKTETK